MTIDVALLLYNRPDHSAVVLDSLIANGVQHVRAFMDHADSPSAQAEQKRLLDVIASRSQLQIDLHRHPRRLGLAASVRYAVTTTLEQSDAVILFEDDCVLRPGGIEFFRQGLAALADDLRVRSLCGYLFPCPFVQESGELLLLRRFSTWGWGTWRDRWQSHNPDLWEVISTLTRRGIRLKDVAGDLARLCGSTTYLENSVDAWSLPWAIEHFATDSFAVYPSASVIDNIGFDGTGQHCRATNVFSAPPAGEKPAWDWHRLVYRPENEDMLRRFMDEHGAAIYPEP